MPGDRVVCVFDDWVLQDGPGAKCNLPKKGEVLSVDYVWNENIGFDNHNTEGEYNWFCYWYFAPVQDATEMEEEETEFAHYKEMTA